MSNELQEIVDETTCERYASRGVTACRTGGTVRIVKDGQARVIVAWIGGDSFVESWEYARGDWRAEVVTRDEIGVRASMAVEALAFD